MALHSGGTDEKDPFAIGVAQEIFQKRLKETIEDIAGVYAIADNILTAGEGDTKEEAERDHEIIGEVPGQLQS